MFLQQLTVSFQLMGGLFDFRRLLFFLDDVGTK